MSLAEMVEEKDWLEEQRRNLYEAAELTEDTKEKRRLRLQALMINEDIINLNDAITRERQMMAAKKAKPKPSRATQPINSEEFEDDQDPSFLKLLEDLHRPEPEPGSLQAMGRSYRREADILRHRIQLVNEIPVKSEVERIEKERRLQILTSMHRDVRDCAVICENYYRPGYTRNERYTI